MLLPKLHRDDGDKKKQVDIMTVTEVEFRRKFGSKNEKKEVSMF